MKSAERTRVLTWNVHGNYLHYLSYANADFFIPVKKGRPHRFGGIPQGFAETRNNLHEVPAHEVKDLDVDIVLYQHRENYSADRTAFLSEAQRMLPSIYLEHDPPREHPTDTKHFVHEKNFLVVHVTHFNDLMWDTPVETRVIEHGVQVPEDIEYSGEYERGAVVINDLALRGRRLGFDVFERVRKEIPLDLFGMNSRELGGKGELPHRMLVRELPRYRFLFYPIRYTSLGLALIEAMQVGVPPVALATSEVAVHLCNGIGYSHTSITRLIEEMRALLEDKSRAQSQGKRAKEYARRVFSIERFARDWEELFEEVTISRADNLRISSILV